MLANISDLFWRHQYTKDGTSRVNLGQMASNSGPVGRWLVPSTNLYASKPKTEMKVDTLFFVKASSWKGLEKILEKFFVNMSASFGKTPNAPKITVHASWLFWGCGAALIHKFRGAWCQHGELADNPLSCNFMPATRRLHVHITDILRSSLIMLDVSSPF